MSDLREQYAEAILERFHGPDDKHATWWINTDEMADAVLAVRDVEVERLRAQVAAAELDVSRYKTQRDGYRLDNRRLRVRLAAVKRAVAPFRFENDFVDVPWSAWSTTAADGARSSGATYVKGCSCGRQVCPTLQALASVPAVDAGDREPASETHIGRSFEGHPLEDDCPCPKAACGLVIHEMVDPDCPQHALTACKTIRQSHSASVCPASEAVRATGPRTGRPDGDGTSGGFEAVTEAHGDASEVCRVCGTSEATGWVGDTCDRCARPCFCGSPGAYSLTRGERIMHAADECVIVHEVQP